ncbi:SRPBCC family protein [Nocardioides solisilvae]|uniref:SRPBCC family protein n=1 Tax=Nocardioides solisilvae TaxID=1542435 RepID=UPI000D74BCA9|nr:SRPBCC family protein [Nocardioides solisilvae]
MELEHSFSLPLPVEEAWAEFQDIGSLAECFPGATVSSADAEGFAGSVKVKLGPIALVYNGSGTFVERDEVSRRMVIDAKGKDKRGNGTAGAHVVLQMSAAGSGTGVRVTTDLSITGKPAQFGRGVMQDVSDKLLGQFVSCLEQRHAAPEVASAEPPGQGAPGPSGASGPSGGPELTSPAAVAGVDAAPPVGGQSPPVRGQAPRGQDALDLGSAALPVLVRTYGPWLLGALVVLVLLRRLLGR